MADPEIPTGFNRFLKRLKVLLAQDSELREAHEAIKADGAEIHIKLWKPDLSEAPSSDDHFLRSLRIKT